MFANELDGIRLRAEAVWADVVQWAAAVAWDRVGGAVLVLLFALWLAGRISTWIRKAAARTPHVDATLAGVAASSARYLVLVCAVVLILAIFRVPATPLVGVLGAAALAIGLALQGALGNVAAGILIIILRPYRVGDVIEIAGKVGIVREITLFTTELATFDNIRVIAPNGKIIAERIDNISFYAERRVDLEFRIAYEDDLEAAIAALQALVASEGKVLRDPAPVVAPTAMGDHGVTVVVWAWCSAPDWFAVKTQLIREGLARLRAAGIGPAYPVQRTSAISGFREG
jgi:small conductance mechanosensitive channel